MIGSLNKLKCDVHVQISVSKQRHVTYLRSKSRAEVFGVYIVAS